MTDVNHSETRVLLVGTSTYPNDKSIKAIPNVEVNLSMLKKTLTNTDLVGIPEENIVLSLNEDNKQIQKKLIDLIKSTKSKLSTLMVYYSGHGIMSANDYELYLTTAQTSTDYLEIEGINIESFKKYIRQSYAGRKILILDCCHSGHIIGSMGDMSSKIQSEIAGFEGTYVMTSAAEDEPSIFPVDEPDKPTHFTGKLIEVIEQGTENEEQEYSSLRDIFRTIESDFSKKGLPRPQQSNVNSADQLFFAKNKKFASRRPADEVAWEKANKKNSKDSFLDFIEEFPTSKFAGQATTHIAQFEEAETWEDAVTRNTISGFVSFKLKFPDSTLIEQASVKITALKKKDESRKKPVIRMEPDPEPEPEPPKKTEPPKVKKAEKKETKKSAVSEDEIAAKYDEILLIADAEERDLAFEKLEEEFKGDKLTYLYKCRVHVSKGEYKKAEKSFQQLFSLFPDYPTAYNNYGHFLSNYVNDQPKAIIAYKKAMELAPGETFFMNNYAFLLMENLKEYDNAKQVLQDALNITDDNATTHFYLGYLERFYLKEPDDAKEHFERAIELNPNSDELQNHYALLLAEEFGEPEKALPHYQKAIELKPGFGVYYFNYALSAFELGRIGEAESYYERATKASTPHVDKDFEKRIQEALASGTSTPAQTAAPPSAVETSTDNTAIVAKFAGVNCRKTKDRKNYVALYGELSDNEVIVRRNSIELKSFLTTLKMTGIISIEYLDANTDTTNSFNYIKINFSHYEKKPLIWNDDLTVLLYKYSLWGGSPTKEIYTELERLIRTKKLLVSG